jgi:hypothetical protein
VSAEASQLGPTGPGAVLAEIGGHLGALVLYTPERLLGAEIDLTGAESGRSTHVAVRARQLAVGTAFAAFYPAIPAGQYHLVDPDTAAGTAVTIRGGAVTTVDWRRPARD